MDRLKEAFDFRDNYEEKVEETVKFLKEKFGDIKALFGLVLGSGLGDLVEAIKNKKEISYEEIPNFPKTSVAGHEGKLIIGELEGVPIIALKGRKHYYEVADELINFGMLQVIFPVHVLASLGVKNYFVTNASGGLKENYKVGDIMIMNSQIHYMPSPLLGRRHKFITFNGERVQRFQPMNEAYNLEFIELLKKASENYKDNVHEGVYVGLTGPTYETEAECLFIKKGMVGDCVGMSTTPEVIIARSRGMEVVGFSCITNVVTNEGVNATSHDEVKEILNSLEVKERLVNVVKNFFKLYSESM